MAATAAFSRDIDPTASSCVSQSPSPASRLLAQDLAGTIVSGEHGVTPRLRTAGLVYALFRARTGKARLSIGRHRRRVRDRP